MKITFIIPSLACGGAERAMSILANQLAQEGHSIVILTWDDGRELPFFPLDHSIQHRPLGIASASTNIIQSVLKTISRIYKLRKAIKLSSPKVVISFLVTTNILTLLSSIGMKIQIVITELADPFQYPKEKILRIFRFLSYPLTDQLVVLTDNAKLFFVSYMPGKLSVIPNPVLPPSEATGQMEMSFKKPFIGALGRLVYEKGFDILLTAFSQIKDRFPDWDLIVVGEGSERNSLEKLIDSFNLRARVSLPGRLRDPFEILKNGEFFVLPSRTEGFPMALCEAMSHGLPVIASDSPGCRTIIRAGIDGYLEPSENVMALAKTMEKLMNNKEERDRLGKSSQEIINRFSFKEFMKQWNECLQQANGES